MPVGRRTWSLACSRVSLGASGVAWFVLAAWLAGRLASDRWFWTQWLLWIPTGAALAAAAAGFTVARLARPRERPRERPRTRRRRLRPALPALLAVAAWMLAGEWRLWDWPRPAPADALRVVVWNAANTKGPSVAPALAEHHADLIVLVNSPAGVRWGRVYDSMRERRDSAWAGPVAVASAYPILRHAGTPLGLRGRLPHPDRAQPGAPAHALDSGWASFIELDTRERFGRNLVVWVLDLPSDVMLPRWRTAGDAAAAIAAWRGPDGAPFPPPDLVVGDFNSPRSAASLGRIARALTHAHAQGGWGPAATYPRSLPLWHLDHAFVATWLRAARYRVADPGDGTHRVQVIDLVQR